MQRPYPTKTKLKSASYKVLAMRMMYFWFWDKIKTGLAQFKREVLTFAATDDKQNLVLLELD